MANVATVAPGAKRRQLAARAVRWWRAAAVAGDAMAYYRAGMLLEGHRPPRAWVFRPT